MDYLKTLNPAQKEAVTWRGDSLLILAGAGSGKTRVITSRIAWLIREAGYSPYSILAVTFTNKAAGEMKERVASMVPEAGNVMIKTFHSFGAWLMRTNHHYTDYLGSRFSVYDESDSISLLQSAFPGRTKKGLSDYASAISRAKDYCLSPSDDLSEVAPAPDFQEVYQAYEERLRGVGNMDFGDLIMKPVEMLRSSEELKLRLQQRFRVIMVDEYQDSNVAQFELLKLLHGSGNSVCVVGDDDQSIYRFRGAEVRNIIDFPEVFPGTKIIRLEQNYRSTKPILDLATAVVSNNEGRLGKTLWTELSDGPKPKVVYLENQQAEAEYCASLLEDGRFNETAILYRTNAQSMSFETCFNRCGIPYRIVGALRFFDREEIKDALSWLSLLLNPRDTVAMGRILNKPSRGLGKVSAGKIEAAVLAQDGGLAALQPDSVNGLSAKSRKSFTEFCNIYRRLAEDSAVLSVSELIAALMEASGLLEYYRSVDENTAKGREQNIRELASSAAEYGAGPDALALFLEECGLNQGSLPGRNEAQDADAVTLITMHNTKGLEFDRVVITGMDEGIFPSGREEGPEELEEERRIFYVSITRARRELYLTTCRSRFMWGQQQSFGPSVFLNEIPADAVETESAYGGGSGAGGEGLYKRGRMVYHDDYGTGVIVKSGTAGGHTFIIVSFETGRSGRFLPEYDAHLELLGNDEW